ncbi:uncharacterized protein LOC143363606 [Halictus rubicundus]|uniref:uncharacterized protein LOC143363606 n=1 Tax=Halictus rubicundus TaxID=77578 RepID=UPI00403659AD
MANNTVSNSTDATTTPNTNTFQALKITEINVNSLISNEKRAALTDYLNAHEPDAVLLCETKLNDRHRVSFKNYVMIRNDRPNSKQGGGTAILIKRKIKFKTIQSDTNLNTTLETTIIKIKVQQKNLFLIAAYAPSSNKKEFTSDLNTIFDKLELHKLNNYYLLAGDLNAKHTDWHNTTNNNRGTTLNKWLHHNLIQYRVTLLNTLLPSFPISGSFIDICLTDNRIKFHRLPAPGSLHTRDYDSDHRATEMTITLDADEPLIIDEPTHTKKYNFNKVNWLDFQTNLLTIDNTIIPNTRNLTIEEIDNYTDKLNTSINSAIDNTIPRIPNDYNSTDRYITPTIKNLKKLKSTLITRLNRLTAITNYTAVNDTRIALTKYTLKIIRKEIKKAFQRSVSDYWRKKISNISKHNSNDLFPSINTIFRAKRQSTINTLKIHNSNSDLLAKANIDSVNTQTDDDGNLLITDIKDKLNVLGAHFENAHTQNNSMGKPQLSDIITQKINTLRTEMDEDRRNNITVCNFSDTNKADNPNTDETPTDFFTSTYELNIILRKLNNKKSSSFDNIPNIILKHLPPRFIYNYTIIFNNCLNSAHFPAAWKTAKTICLKKKDKNESIPASYRPISLLPNISKIFEITINNAIEAVCAERKLIPETQFGFRRNHSTVHAITKFTSDICWARNAGDCVGAVFIDLEKAFDTVWLDGLFYKLLKKNFPKHLIKILWNMVHGKKFQVVEGPNTSPRKFEVSNGLQQGAVNSPILFSLYMSDLLNMYDLNNDNQRGAIAYADDLLIYISDNKPSKLQTKLQNLFDKIQDYFDSWKLKINTNKCETILFRPYISQISDANRDVRKNARHFHIRDNRDANIIIPHKKVVRYLGVHLDFKLNYNEHVNIQISKAQKAFAANKRLFHSKDLDSSVKILCYKMLIKPIIFYGFPIWFNISASTMEKIRLLERKCLRACLNVYRTPESNYTKYISNHNLLLKAQIPRIDIHMIKLARNHWANTRRIQNNSLIFSSTYPNPLYHEITRHTGYIPPEAFIHLDKAGLIQNTLGHPILYHHNRKNYNKTITYNNNCSIDDPDMRFRHKLTQYDTEDDHRKNTDKYWWLDEPT